MEPGRRRRRTREEQVAGHQPRCSEAGVAITYCRRCVTRYSARALKTTLLASEAHVEHVYRRAQVDRQGAHEWL